MKKNISDNTYLKRGVSSTKDDVHNAIKNQSLGLFPGAFCKIENDLFADETFCNIMHADGAGTKSSLAYLHYKETGEAKIFQGIAQDSLVMNTDDLLCVGAIDTFLVSNTIGRNAHRVGGGVISEIITGYETIKNMLATYGITLTMAGGETADVGDLVATIIVDSTIFTRIKKKDVIDCSNILPGNVIIGLASFGKATYETRENSGIGSNGLTAARHLLLSKHYAQKYPETFSSTLTADQYYTGKYLLSDNLPDSSQTISQALLSPTRTYLPIIKTILEKHKKNITGIIHSSGGGQVKCKNFGTSLHYIKDSLFDMPPIFQALFETQQMSLKEMYQVFNMGQRLEIYTDNDSAQDIIDIAKSFHIDAKIIGRVEKSKHKKNMVTITHQNKSFEYQ